MMDLYRNKSRQTVEMEQMADEHQETLQDMARLQAKLDNSITENTQLEVRGQSLLACMYVTFNFNALVS